MRTFAMVLLAAMLLPCSGVRAGILYGNIADTDVRSDGVVSADSGSSLIAGGAGSSPARDRSAVFVFKLPYLGAVSAPFATANLQFDLSSIKNTPPSVDLYGLARRFGSTVLAGDYYGETSAADTNDATFLQNNILIATSTPGPISTSSSGDTALRNYLNAQYDGGAGAGSYVFLRLSTDAPVGGVNRYVLTSANSGSAGPPDTRPQIQYTVSVDYTRPFIWVRDSERADILAKIASNAWAGSVYSGMVARVAASFLNHQTNRDAFLRQLPVDWTLSPPKFKTVPAYAESSVRYPAAAKFNDAVDCAVLYYHTANTNYARCAADILHNAVKTLIPVTPSSSVGNGGWIFQTDFLKEARVTGPQLPIVYDFLYSYLQSNKVYDVTTASMVSFSFTNAQTVFRTLYQLARDHGSKDSNWSALMATCMLNSLLALDSKTERDAALNVYLVTGSSRQASLDYDYRNYPVPGSVWPESLQYASGVVQIRSTDLVQLERIDPNLELFASYPNYPLSLPRISQLHYPNDDQISFGDGDRAGSGIPYFICELVYQHAAARGLSEMTDFLGPLINAGVSNGEYNRSSLRAYESLGPHASPLQLLWQAPLISETPAALALPRTDTVPFAGIALQRNPAPASNNKYGLMCFAGGAGHVHSHASGMSMELFGAGEVMGAKSGRDDYGSAIHENYYRLFAANNTVIVNGGSRGQGGWSDIEINTVQTVAMEPQPFAAAVSPNHSFTVSSFADDKGNLAEATQQRTLAIIRTSPTNGFYVDIFRSKSTVSNRVATTLNGNVTNQYHDYIYRNIGETNVDVRASDGPLPFVSQPNRFQNDIGDAYDQPGWRYFTSTVVSYPTNQTVLAQFAATISGTPRYMDMHVPAVASREFALVSGPPIIDAPSPYNSKRSPALVIRQIGEAWNKAFAAVYEPHYGTTGTVRSVSRLEQGGIVRGVKVESVVGGRSIVHYVFSNPSDGSTYQENTIGLSFVGRFGVIADHGDGSVDLYLGQGSSMSYRGYALATTSGVSSQAEARFVPGLPADVTANAPVVTLSAAPPVIDNIGLQANGSMSLIALGSQGVPYRLWSSTNLLRDSWSLLGTGEVSASPFVVVDTNAPADPSRFYRFSLP